MDDIEKKQNYLREEIMEQNYDPDLFSEFLSSKKGDDAFNLDLWTFDELQEAVQEFKEKIAEYHKVQAEKEQKEKNYFSEDPYQNSHNQQGGQQQGMQQQQQQQEKQQSQSQIQSNQDKDNQEGLSKKVSKEGIGNQDNTAYDQQITLDIDYNETIPAKKLPKSVFEQYDTITISIANVEKNQGGIFTKAFMTYRLITEEPKLNVVRRYSDFKLLQELLQNVFIGCCIPPLPAKKIGDGFIDTFVNKRKRYLQKFIRALLTIPIIRNCPILFDFLSITDEIEFKKSMTKYNTELTRPTFNNILSLDGLLELHISKDTNTQIELIKGNNIQNELLLTKLSLLSKCLYQEIQQVSNRMVELSDILNQLKDCSNNCTNDTEIITDLYRIMSKVMKKWSDCEKCKSSLIEINIRELFKYSKNEFAMMRDLFDKTESSHKNFYKQFKQITVRKEELFRKGEIRNWELSEEDMKNSAELLSNKKLALSKMLPKRTEEMTLAKKEYGYYTTSVLSEYKRLRRVNGSRLKDNCVYLSNANNEMINAMYQMWVSAMMEIESIDFSK